MVGGTSWLAMMMDRWWFLYFTELSFSSHAWEERWKYGRGSRHNGNAAYEISFIDSIHYGFLPWEILFIILKVIYSIYTCSYYLLGHSPTQRWGTEYLHDTPFCLSSSPLWLGIISIPTGIIHPYVQVPYLLFVSPYRVEYSDLL